MGNSDTNATDNNSNTTPAKPFLILPPSNEPKFKTNDEVWALVSKIGDRYLFSKTKILEVIYSYKNGKSEFAGYLTASSIANCNMNKANSIFATKEDVEAFLESLSNESTSSN